MNQDSTITQEQDLTKTQTQDQDLDTNKDSAPAPTPAPMPLRRKKDSRSEPQVDLTNEQDMEVENPFRFGDEDLEDAQRPEEDSSSEPETQSAEESSETKEVPMPDEDLCEQIFSLSDKLYDDKLTRRDFRKKIQELIGNRPVLNLKNPIQKKRSQSKTQTQKRKKLPIKYTKDENGQIKEEPKSPSENTKSRSQPPVIEFDWRHAEPVTPNELSKCDCCKKPITEEDGIGLIARWTKVSGRDKVILICGWCTSNVDIEKDKNTEPDERNPLIHIPTKKEKGVRLPDWTGMPKFCQRTSSLTVCQSNLAKTPFSVLQYFVDQRKKGEKVPYALPAYVYFPQYDKCLIEPIAFCNEMINNECKQLDEEYNTFDYLTEASPNFFKKIPDDPNYPTLQGEEADY